MIKETKNTLDTIYIFNSSNKADNDKLSAIFGKYEHYYNVYNELVVIIENTTYVRQRIENGFILAQPIDAGAIAVKQRIRKKNKESERYAQIKPINCKAKTNISGFKQWCSVSKITYPAGRYAYKLTNKSGHTLISKPLQDTSTGRLFYIFDRITAVKREVAHE